MSSAVDYRVVIKDFADTTTFGPGSNIAVLENATNVGWTEYINEVGEAYFTLSQKDAKILLLGTALNYGKHCLIYRNGTLVWGGWLGEADETLEDVVFTAYSYLSGFYHYLMPWDQQWVGWNAHSVMDAAYIYARDYTKSRVGWITRGTIETLWVESGGPTSLTLPLYRASYKRVLSVLREIAAYAISDTTNRVRFAVTPDGVFSILRNDTVDLTDVRWRLGDGFVRGFRRLRLPVDSRNQIIAVGSSPNSTTLKTTITKTTEQNAYGTKQEPIYLSWVRDSTELTRVASIRATRAIRIDTDLYISFFKNSVVPYRATGQDFAIGNTVSLVMDRGITSLSGAAADKKIIAGQQVIFRDGDEYVRVLLSDVAA